MSVRHPRTLSPTSASYNQTVFHLAIGGVNVEEGVFIASAKGVEDFPTGALVLRGARSLLINVDGVGGEDGLVILFVGIQRHVFSAP